MLYDAVNAANEGCLGGGGVDGAIGNAGGPQLLNDRQQLPELSPGVRCKTGDAVITGPNNYGSLNVPFVIHAVGPNYLDYDEDDIEQMSLGDALLKSAYTTCLTCCGQTANLESIAFCLLSAGIFRGSRSVRHVLQIGLEAIAQFDGYEGLKSVYVCGFTQKELSTLVTIANEIGLVKVVVDDNNSNNADNKSERDSSSNKECTQQQEQQDKPGESSQKDSSSGKGEQQEEEKKEQVAREDWEIQRDELKTTGDTHFRSKSFTLAISAYEDALQLDPTNHVILSNKSAAHLANGEKSKALHDARKCVEHNSSWAKGHTRLAAAMMSLGRYNEAAGVYSKVLNELEPNNSAAKKGLEDCRLKQQKAREEKEKEASRLQMELDRQKTEKEEKEKRKNDPAKDEADDLLDDFFDEVEKATDKPKKSDANDEGNDKGSDRIKTQINDLGTSSSQIDRLLQINYEWKNLNPFHVIDIPHTVDDESIISTRYRALSLLVHPDKCPDDPVRAKTAFEEVRKAMTQMNDENKRRHVQALVVQGMKHGKRDWETETKSKGIFTTSEEEGLKQAQSKAVMRIFAEIEQKRRNIERRKHEFEQRERAQEDEEKTKEKNEREHDKKWREGDRVEKRIGNWRDFAGSKGGSKKGRLV